MNWEMDMRCQNCGTENLDRHIFCDRCGAVIVRPYRIDTAAISGPKQEIVRAIDQREHTDAIVPTILIWVYILLYVVIIVAGFALSIVSFTGSISAPSFFVTGTLSTVGSVALTVIVLYVYYKLVKRQNDHYARERLLRTSIISLVRAASDTPEKRSFVEYDLAVMDSINAVVDRPRRVWFWVLVAVLPQLTLPILLAVMWVGEGESIVLLFVLISVVTVVVSLASLILQLYMYWFLGETMFQHDGRWGTFSMTARGALSKLGFPAGKPFGVKRLPRRNFVLYVILTIFTGIFLYYWLYVLVKDPNEHFKNQWEFEDNILSAMGVQRLQTLKSTGWTP